MYKYCIYITNNLDYEYIRNSITYFKNNNFNTIVIDNINKLKTELLNINNKESCILIIDSNYIIINSNLLIYCSIVYNNKDILFYDKEKIIACILHYNHINYYINLIYSKNISNLKSKTIINHNLINYISNTLFDIDNPTICNQYVYKIPIIKTNIFKFINYNLIDENLYNLNKSVISLKSDWDKIYNIDKYKYYNSHYNNKTILIYKTHINNDYNIKVNINNFKQISLNYFDIIIIVYSGVKDYKIDLVHNNIIYIYDNINIGLDFGKEKLAYEYIIKNNIDNDIIYLINDSIIITKNIDNLIINIFNKIKYCSFVGLVNNKQINEHFQSWFLVFRKNCFKYRYENLNLLTLNKNSLINEYEINLSIKITNIFEYNYIFNVINDKNIMYDLDNEYLTFYIKGFNFIKINRIKNIPKRPKIPSEIYNDYKKLLIT